MRPHFLLTGQCSDAVPGPLLLLPGLDAFRTNADGPDPPGTGLRRSRDVYEGPDLDFLGDNPFATPDLTAVVTQVVRRRRLNPTSIMQLREFALVRVSTIHI